jgi:hypothetical protein
MEGKKVHHLLAARGSEYDALRERLGGVTPSLLDDLQDLHDRSGACMPNLYRHLALAGAQRIAQSFKLSMRLVHRCATYQHLRGAQIFSTPGTRAIPAPARAVDVIPAPDLAAAPAVDIPAAAPAVDIPAAAPAVDVPAAAPAVDASPTPDLPAAPTPAPEPMQLTEHPQEDLDLIARGIAKAIAAATAHGLNQPGRR